jgi:hypothetical protein
VVVGKLYYMLFRRVMRVVRVLREVMLRQVVLKRRLL